MSSTFLVTGVRTPIGRYGGALSSVRPDDLAAHVVRELLQRLPRVDPAAIDDVVLGCANQAGEDNRNVARMAALLAGLPESVSGITVNRLCASGLDAVLHASASIAAGQADLVIAGGVESMSRAPFVISKAPSAFSRDAEMFDTTIGWRFVNPRMAEPFGTDSMPETAENVAEARAIPRADQDAFAWRSQQRTAAAQDRGRLAREITAVAIPQRGGAPVVVDRDEHPRATTLDRLAALPAPFRPGGTRHRRQLLRDQRRRGRTAAGLRSRGRALRPRPARPRGRRRDRRRGPGHHGPRVRCRRRASSSPAPA